MGKVMTVLGPVDSKDLGKTLSHEHIFCDFTCFLLEPKTDAEKAFMEEPVNLDNLWSMRVNPYANRDECVLDSMGTAIKELEVFKQYGGKTICELSLDGCGRNPERLKEVAEKTGLNIIGGTGHYIYSTLPQVVFESSAEQLANIYVDEFKNGIRDTGVRPGIIGEIGTSETLYPEEIKVLHAAGMAQRETGMAVTIHVDAGSHHGHEVLDILIKEEGVSPDKIVLGHMDFLLTQKDLAPGEGMDILLSMANRGCYIEFDLCGNTTVYKRPKGSWVLPTDLQRTQAIATLCKHGFSDRVLCSHDQGLKHFLRSYGGWGYSHVLNDFQTYLGEAGVEPHTAKLFNEDNPARLLELRK